MLHLASVHGTMANAQASMPAAFMRRKSTEVSIVAIGLSVRLALRMQMVVCWG